MAGSLKGKGAENVCSKNCIKAHYMTNSDYVIVCFLLIDCKNKYVEL